MGRRTLLRGAALFAVRGVLPAIVPLASLLGGCASRPLRVAFHPWPGYEFLPVAAQRNWLTSSDAELVFTRDASHSRELIQSGSIDVVALTLDEVLRVRAQGVDLRVVCVFDVSAGADVLLAKQHIRSLAELKGQRVAVEAGGVGSLLLREALSRAGLSEADITVVPMGLERQARALLENEIDAVVSYEPEAGRLEASGLRRLFDSRAIPDTIFDVLAIRADRVIGNEARLEKLLLGHFRVLQEFRRHPYDIAFTMAERLGMNGQSVPQLFSGLFLPGIDENRRLLADGEGKTPAGKPKPAPVVVAARRLRTELGLSGALLDDLALQQLTRADFLPQSALP